MFFACANLAYKKIIPQTAENYNAGWKFSGVDNPSCFLYNRCASKTDSRVGRPKGRL